MEILLINQKSKWLRLVQNLGDASSDTVGFLAREAYSDYARKGNILVVIENDQLLAYTMFRFRKNSIVIVHLCVDPKARGKGIPSAMIEWLLEQNKEYISHMQLACRRDYNLDRFWQKLGFSAVAEKAGRAVTDRTILTIWVRENPECRDLFATLAGSNADKALVVLDTNIVIDLCSGADEESNSLVQSYLGTYAEFRITKYVVNEINQNNNPSIRNTHRDYAKEHYTTLENVDEELFQRVKAELLQMRNVAEYSNMWYDIAHIAQSIAADADVFITRDEGWLNNDTSKYIYQKYGLRILSPGEFINSIDELSSPSDYSPLKLAGLGLEYSKMQNLDFSATVDAFFQSYGVRKTQFEKNLRKWIGLPDIYTVLLIKSVSVPVCLVVHRVQSHTMEVEAFLINAVKIRPSLQKTFVKRIAFKLLDDAHRINVNRIRISKNGLTKDICDSLRDCGYFEDDGHMLRVINAEVLSVNALRVINNLPDTSLLNVAINRLKNDCSAGLVGYEQVVSLEKALWPMKLCGVNMPCFIVPIKAEYAVQLFDENLYNQQVTWFENEKPEPALSIENAYFKTAKHSVPQTPARILWYVSSSDYIGTPAIRACSYLDRVEKGSAKELFARYKRLGVLEWRDLAELGTKGDVATYIFSYTELFETPIGLDQIREMIERPRETFQSFCTIDEQTFLRIYQAGTQGDNYED